ncbi:hypothetical protein DZG02_15370, partial [Clavibacter lycopersici]
MSSDAAAAAWSPAVVIAVLTYRRPRDIAAVLPMLVDQAASVGGTARVRILVVDNDPEAGARAAVAA